MAKRVVTLWRAAGLGVACSLVSGAGFAIEPDTATGPDATKSAACLSGPKGAAPQGERWFYRVERGTKKHCWYTRADTARNVASRTQAPVPVAAAEAAPAPLQPSVADARAEVTPSVFPPPPAVVAPPAMPTEAPGRSLAERIADHPDADRPAQPRPATATPQIVANPAAANSAVTKPSVGKPSDAGSSADQGTSFWMLLSAIGGVMGLVGLAFGAIKRFARPRVTTLQGDRWAAAQWDDEADTSPPLAHNDDDQTAQWDSPPMNWVRIAREREDERAEDVERLLARSRRPA